MRRTFSWSFASACLLAVVVAGGGCDSRTAALPQLDVCLDGCRPAQGDCRAGYACLPSGVPGSWVCYRF